MTSLQHEQYEQHGHHEQLDNQMDNRQSDRRLHNQDGVGLILEQLKRVKRRLNLRALQDLLFPALGLLAGAGGLLVIAAFFLGLKAFIAVGCALVLAVAVGVPWTIKRAVKQFASLARTAAVADQRAELHGRLTALTSGGPRFQVSPLWPYLVEEARGRLDDFTPVQIAGRALSRTLYAFLGGLLLAACAAILFRSASLGRLTGLQKDLTLQIDPSELQLSDAPNDQSSQLQGDGQSLRNLAQQLLADPTALAAAHHSELHALAQHAASVASDLQRRLTGQKPPPEPSKLRVQVADADGKKGNGGYGNNPNHGGGQSNAQSSGSQPSQGGLGGAAGRQGGSNSPPPGAQHPGIAGQMASAGDSMSTGAHGSSSQMASGESSHGSGSGGAAAGTGVDPDTLLGPPDAPGRKNGNFEIMIDAQLSDKTRIHNGQPYTPPRVDTQLSRTQHADEPSDRATVPPDDRDTIRQVFER